MGIITALKRSAYTRGTIKSPAKCHFYYFRSFSCMHVHLYSGTMLLSWFTFTCVEYVLEVQFYNQYVSFMILGLTFQFYNQYLSFMILGLTLLAMFGRLFCMYFVWE